MNKPKLFGIFVMVLLAVTIVNATNETMLNNLLDSYDNSYDDGLFNVSFINSANTIASLNSESGNITLTFSIGGTGTSSPYTVITTTDIETKYEDELNSKNIIKETTKSGAGLLNILFDGNYYYCKNIVENNGYFDTDFKIYQDGVLHYQKRLKNEVLCETTYPISLWYVEYYPPLDKSVIIEGIDTNGDTKDELLNVTLNVGINEAGTYAVGVYIGDNKSSSAYGETITTITSSDYYANNYVLIIFNSTQLRDFELNNEIITVNGYSVNGIPITNFDKGYFNQFNRNLFSTSDFNFSEIYLTSYNFNPVIEDGKIAELGAVLDASGTTGIYNVTLSLENQVGELIGIKNELVNSWPYTFWFNGTDIYESKINGPYRLGFVKVIKNNEELVYKLNKGTTGELSYLNFTTPPMPDLEINDANVTGDGNDINVTLYNRGAGDAAGITLSVFNANANKVDEIIIDSINSNKNYTYKFAGINLTSAFVAIDFNNNVEETNESNNIAVLRVQGTVIEPIKLNYVQPLQNSVALTDGQSLQFNISVNGTSPNYVWLFNNTIVSTANSYILTPTYYDEGTRQLKVIVNNTNTTVPVQYTWNINVTPQKMAVFAYTYDKAGIVANSTFNAIDADIDFDGVIKQSTNTELPAKINLTTNTEHNITYSSSGYNSSSTKMYFDSRLFRCIENQNCNFDTATYDTSCAWDSANNNNWACTITNGTFKDYFRLYPNPKRVKISNYLEK